MEWDGFDRIVGYAELEDEPMYDDFESIVSDVLDARGEKRSFTSSQLPEGFDSEKLEDEDFGFRAEKVYDEGSIEVEYVEHSSISFGKQDSSTVEVRVEPFGYLFSENWEQKH